MAKEQIRNLDVYRTVFAPEVYLPTQLPSRTSISSELRLMLAVLEDAMHEFIKGRKIDANTKWYKRIKRRSLEAEQWLRSSDTTWLFSFENICASLDWDPEYLRKGLLDEGREFKKNRAVVVRYTQLALSKRLPASTKTRVMAESVYS